MSSGLMDTAPGGESDQYESQQTVTNPHSKQGGQMGDTETQVDAVDAHEAQSIAEKGQKTAENVRYGQNISESGMGGKTTETGGSANQGSGFGGTGAQTETDSAEESRQQSGGYGQGTGIGG